MKIKQYEAYSGGFRYRPKVNAHTQESRKPALKGMDLIRYFGLVEDGMPIKATDQKLEHFLEDQRLPETKLDVVQNLIKQVQKRLQIIRFNREKKAE